MPSFEATATIAGQARQVWDTLLRTEHQPIWDPDRQPSFDAFASGLRAAVEHPEP